MNAPTMTTTAILTLSGSVAEECRLACLPNKSPAEMARLRLLQTANALKQAGQDESHPRPSYRTNPHDA